MVNIKVKYATGEYFYTDTYGKVKVLGCKPVNTYIVQQEDGTILELTVPYAGANTLNASNVKIVEEDSSDEGSGSESGGSVATEA